MTKNLKFVGINWIQFNSLYAFVFRRHFNPCTAASNRHSSVSAASYLVSCAGEGEVKLIPGNVTEYWGGGGIKGGDIPGTLWEVTVLGNSILIQWSG